MHPIVIYLLKCIVCSGLLYAYYRIAFYNRVNHQWNRCFLLAAVLFSLFLPLIKIHVPLDIAGARPDVVKMLNVVVSDDVETDAFMLTTVRSFDYSYMFGVSYLCISVVFLIMFIKSLLIIRKIYRSSQSQTFETYRLAITTARQAPFTFMRTIFWNKRIDMGSVAGKRIFDHELVHVRQLHSVDRLLMNVVVAVFWCNPFFWLIRKELVSVHEFIADQEAITVDQTLSFSEMILLSAFPGNNFSVASTFFNSSIKRRLIMLTKTRNQKALHIAKWLLAPVILLMVAGFSFKARNVLQPKATFTLMIDAGHGGERSGAHAFDGTLEKDLTLVIANKIKDLNDQPNIKILMTREDDRDVPLRDRVAKANTSGVDAFLSIHLNNAEASMSGIDVIMTKNTSPYAEKSRLLGSLLSKELAKVYKVQDELKQVPADRKVWVLDAPEITYPSLLVEFGNLQNADDMKFIKSPDNQEKLARQVLNAVALFAQRK